MLKREWQSKETRKREITHQLASITHDLDASPHMKFIIAAYDLDMAEQAIAKYREKWPEDKDHE